MTGPPPPEQLLQEAALALWLNVPVKTLRNWRTTGGGPPFVKVGRSVRYQPADVQGWLDGRRFDRTPVPGAPLAVVPRSRAS